jgi:hypothetical protein
MGDQIKPETAVRIRPAEWKDAEAIDQVNNRNGMGHTDPVVWRECWEAYPFAEEFREIPIGWVLETANGSVVGNLSNVHTLYDLGGRRLRGTVAAAWAVDVEYRSKSLRLMTTFFKQKGVDLWLNVSANPTTARLLTGMKILRVPIPDYGSPCLWSLHPHTFARAALSRRSIPGAAGLAWPVGLVLLVGDIFRRSGRGRLSSPVCRLEKFDDRFDSLWQRISAGPLRLRAVRTQAVLEWRFRVEFRDRRIAIVAAERGGALSGYAVLVRRPGSELGMELYDIADIQAVGDDPVTMRDLLLGSMRVAREDGMDAIKFISGTPAKRLPAAQLRPYSYRLPFWQQYFQVATPELRSALSTADAWDFSLFDSY